MTEETKKFARSSGEFETGSVQIEDFEFYACLPKKLADLINAAHEKAVFKAWEEGRRDGLREAAWICEQVGEYEHADDFAKLIRSKLGEKP